MCFLQCIYTQSLMAGVVTKGIKGLTLAATAVTAASQINDGMHSKPQVPQRRTQQRAVRPSPGVVDRVDDLKQSSLNSLGLFYGFVPIHPAMIGIQIPVMVILTIILAYAFDLSWKGAFLISYVTQAIIAAYLFSRVTSVISTVLIGV